MKYVQGRAEGWFQPGGRDCCEKEDSLRLGLPRVNFTLNRTRILNGI